MKDGEWVPPQQENDLYEDFINKTLPVFEAHLYDLISCEIQDICLPGVPRPPLKVNDVLEKLKNMTSIVCLQ